MIIYEPRHDKTNKMECIGENFPGFSSFRPPLMNDRLDISEIFLKVG